MHSHNNGLKTALLMGSMVGMMLLIGGLLSATFRTSIFIWVMGLFSLGSVAYTYWNSDKLALRSMNAYPVSREEVPVLYDIVGGAVLPRGSAHARPLRGTDHRPRTRLRPVVTRRTRRCAVPRVFAVAG